MIKQIMPALELLGQGMAGIFLVLILIALIVALLKQLDRGKK